MIGAALSLEWRNLLRSPLRLLVLLLVAGAGVFVIVQGQQDVERWHQAIEAARAEQDETLTEAREQFAAGRTGPEGRPWINLTQPRWQDWYAATRLVREPAPLAGMAFASPELGAVAVRLNRMADPMLSQGTQIENPELATAGGLDFITVLALLLPLMILALGVEVGGHERASGILPLVRVQSGRDRSWIWARSLAVGAIGGVTGLFLAITACIVGSADMGSSLALCLSVIVYVAVWTGLLAAVALFARHPSQGAVAMGAVWITLCVLVPAIGVERSASLAAEDFAVDLTVEARDSGRELRDLDEDALFAALFGRFPRLESLVPEDRAAAARAARDGLRILGLEERLERRNERGQEQVQLVERMSFASPTVAFTLALERLAGRGPETVQDYQHAVVAAAADRTERFITATWSAKPLDVDDFEALHAATPASMESESGVAWTQLGIMLAWAFSFVAIAGMFSRLDRRRRITDVQEPVSATATTRAAEISS